METFKKNIKKQIDHLEIPQHFKIGEKIHAYINLGTRKTAQNVSENVLSNMFFNVLTFRTFLVNFIKTRTTAIETASAAETSSRSLWVLDYCIKSGFESHEYKPDNGIKEFETF